MYIIEQELKLNTIKAFAALYQAAIEEKEITINITKPDHEGDFTVVVFPLIKHSKQNPEQTANALGTYLQENLGIINKFNVVKGFLNLTFTDVFWIKQLEAISAQASFGQFAPNGKKVLLEYCGPNTNKPLHIGHVRNMLLGFSMSEILSANGYEVIKVNIYNDRGIAICKSMAAYLLRGNSATPASTGIKGDHFVGDYYVLFGQIVVEELHNKYQVPGDENVFKAIGKEREVAEQETEAFALAKSLLLKWEAGDEETVALWKRMNGWVYEGFRKTYDLLGVDFVKEYYESETYKLGKNIIEEGLSKQVFHKRADGAVAIDLTPDGLDEKVLLRSDGTSIYITQDLGTAESRYDEFHMEKMIYVVANEQDYHFKVLKLALQKLGKKWADGIYHLSYALVESPTGRFKSREGKTADADDMISEVLRIAEENTKELGKIDDFTESEAKELYHTIGMGALKFFVLRVNPYKKIIFNPEESIDFHGHTGPFIQYVHARICSVLRKAETVPALDTVTLSEIHAIERELIIQLNEYPNMLHTAAEKYDPSEVANYVYKLAQSYNKFFAELRIIQANTQAEKDFRVALSAQVGRILKHGMKLLGIAVPEKM
jgi:arginyl-tRNA synthetase